MAKDMQALPADKQIEAVNKKLAELNTGYQTDLSIVRTAIDEHGAVTEFRLPTNSVTDLSPVRALAKLKLLTCGSSKNQQTKLSDLSPLRGMSSLEYLNCRNTSIQELTPLHSLPNLRYLNVTNTKVTYAEITAFKKALPNCNVDWGNPAEQTTSTSSRKLWMHDSAFPDWLKRVQALGEDERFEQVKAKLMEINPGFDGKIQKYKSKDLINSISMICDHLRDLSPLKALTTLQRLDCPGSLGTPDTLADLSPLKGMRLVQLNIGNSQVSDLSPLQGMPLEDLKIYRTKVKDLSPLKGMPLKVFTAYGHELTDLSPLQTCKQLTSVNVQSHTVTADTVAALQKALPNCKIEWEDPAKASATPNVSARPETTRTWNSREVAEWVIQHGGSLMINRVDVLKLADIPQTEIKQIDLVSFKDVPAIDATDTNHALTILDKVIRLQKESGNYRTMRELFSAVDARLFVKFIEVAWGKRLITKPAGGILTFGSVQPPVEIYQGNTGRNDLKETMKKEQPHQRGETVSSSADEKESDSLGNVNRGDRI